ncbi:MAG: HD-GYP domain-containing protein [Thermacetogeniaceae bacterium]
MEEDPAIALLRMLEAKDLDTGEHLRRLRHLVIPFGRKAGLPNERVCELIRFAWLHDIGKIGIREEIISKPGPLTPEELREMREHSLIGYNILRSLPSLSHIADWVLKHHERWDGGGYPLGLKGEEIPFECRLLAIADAYDAMTSDRPYRRALGHRDALRELQRCAGTQFDPKLVAVFCSIFVGERRGVVRYLSEARMRRAALIESVVK